MACRPLVRLSNVLATPLRTRIPVRQIVPYTGNHSTGYHQQQQARHSSHSPQGTSPVNPRKKVTIQTLQNLYKKNEPITMLTAHDFPGAHVAEAAGMEMILVGDSLAMVALGMSDTSEISLDEMLLHCRSVSRAASTGFVVCFESFFVRVT